MLIFVYLVCPYVCTSVRTTILCTNQHNRLPCHSRTVISRDRRKPSTDYGPYVRSWSLAHSRAYYAEANQTREGKLQQGPRLSVTYTHTSTRHTIHTHAHANTHTHTHIHIRIHVRTHTHTSMACSRSVSLFDFCAALALTLVLLPTSSAHLRREPGRFSNPHLQPPAAAFTAGACDLSFELGGAQYDLSDLQVDVGGYIADNFASDGKEYCLNVCRTVTSDRNCVCYPCGGSQYPAQQAEKTSKGQQCTAYLGTLDGAKWSLLKASTPTAGVALEYPGGEAGTHTRIEFACDPRADQYSNPAFVGQRAGTYMFRWNATQACPKKPRVVS